MYKHIKVISLILITVFAFGLCACTKVSDDTVVINNKYAEYMFDKYMECFKVSDIKTINKLSNEIASCDSYKDRVDTVNLILDEVYKYIENNKKDFYEMSKYTLSKLSEISLADNDTTQKLQDVYKALTDKINEKTFEYLTGTWERVDETAFNGGRIKIDFYDYGGVEYFLAEIEKLPKINEFAFEKGEIKWKDIILNDEKSFYFNDLVHGKEGIRYEMAEAIINKSENTINVTYTDKYSSTANNRQIWKKVK